MKHTVLFLSAAVTAFQASLSAQIFAPVAEVQGKVSGGYTYLSESSYESNDELGPSGDISYHVFSGQVNVATPVGQNGTLRIGVDYEYLAADNDTTSPAEKTFSETGTVVSTVREPHRDLQSFNVTGTYVYDIDETWDAWAFGGLSIGYENTAGLGNANEITAGLGATYKVRDGFTVFAGVFGGIREENDDVIYPIVGFFWRVTEQFTLYTRNGVFGMFSLDSDRTHVLDFGIEYDVQTYAISDETVRNYQEPVPGSPGERVAPEDAVARYSAFPATIGYTYRIDETFSVRVHGQLVFDAKYELRAEGREFNQIDFDDVMWGLGIKFTASY